MIVIALFPSSSHLSFEKFAPKRAVQVVYITTNSLSDLMNADLVRQTSMTSHHQLHITAILRSTGIDTAEGAASVNASVSCRGGSRRSGVASLVCSTYARTKCAVRVKAESGAREQCRCA